MVLETVFVLSIQPAAQQGSLIATVTREQLFQDFTLRLSATRTELECEIVNNLRRVLSLPLRYYAFIW